MIVVTVGTQLPFDRLIRMIDELAPGLDGDVFAQTGVGTYVPQNMQWSSTVEASDFDRKLKACSVIVAHAGIGTVLKAYKYAKPIILVPRLSSLGEHRNDHQLATVSQLRQREGIYVAENKQDLGRLLSQQLDPATPSEDVAASAARLRGYVRNYILEMLG
ncbi:glucuronosyltransferase [Rhizobium sp. ACO-34A]|nr:glycosyltransferase [Rhizobium sp. ACO-34A]ATN32330.1 glucuronosyltransferase [Rhizobium sp. ACO-34A]